LGLIAQRLLASSRSETDFARFSLAGPALETAGRNLLLTIDFEAFDPSLIDVWINAMKLWADQSTRTNLSFSLFIALEDVARLRHQRPNDYAAFLCGVKMLHDSGAEFYPHNHGVFDIDTGARDPHLQRRVPGYAKRPSFFLTSFISMVGTYANGL
jgi:hypothetical protein